MKKILSLKSVIISLAILISIWQIAFLISDYNSALFPSPFQALQALIEMFKDGSMIENIITSMYRFAIGYISAIITAVILGQILGRLPVVFKYVNPSLQLIRPISPTAWMPFIVLLFGIGDIPAIVIIFIAAFIPVLLSTVSAVGGIDRIYFKVSKNFGIRQP